MSPINLPLSQARRIILHATGLSKRGQFGKGKAGVLKFIDHLGFVQIDTNYVVERAHHHAIATRVPGYKKEWLDELQAEGKVFEFWTFAAGYMPMHDFRFSFPVKEMFATRRNALTQTEINVMRMVLDRISREGPLRARDFDNDRTSKSSGWWDWRPSKLALERLHLDGRLITLRRKDFQKVYDLPENVIPRDADLTPPETDEFTRHVILRALKSLGIASIKEIAYTNKFIKLPLKDEIQKLVDAGEVCPVAVQGLKSPLFMLSSYRKKKIALSGEAFILSPFDILNVFRHRLRDFFNFDYQVECFVPQAKRKYGYFSLPVLINDTFVARMDAKADRKESRLIIHNLHFEPMRITAPVVTKISNAIKAFAKFSVCTGIAIEKTNDKVAAKAIQKILNH